MTRQRTWEALYARYLRRGRMWYRTSRAARDYARAMTDTAMARHRWETE